MVLSLQMKTAPEKYCRQSGICKENSTLAVLLLLDAALKYESKN